MKKTLSTAAAVTGAAILLTACGSDGGSDDKDDIKGAGSGTPSASASAGPDRPARPKVVLPDDLDVSFEGFTTGDPVKDSVLADSADRVRALDAAKVEGKTGTAAVTFYTHPMALAGAKESLKFYADKGYSVTGKFRYFAPAVSVTGKSAELTYCGDETKGFGKERKTGKVLKTKADANSYVLYTARLRKSAKGVWQTAEISTDRGAAKCRQ